MTSKIPSGAASGPAAPSASSSNSDHHAPGLPSRKSALQMVVQGKLAGLKPLSPLESMPPELAHAVLNAVPNGRKVQSLALTSPPLYLKLAPRTRQKVNASRLMGDAKSLNEFLPPGAEAREHTLQEIFEWRFAESQNVLATANDLKANLLENDRLDVLIALTSASAPARWYGSTEAFELMLESLEGLGQGWSAITTPYKAHRAEKQLQLDQAKLTMLHNLCAALSPTETDEEAGEDIDEEKGEYFDRLCEVLCSIHAPEIKDRAIRNLALSELYNSFTAEIGPTRFRKLFDFVDSNLEVISDDAKECAITTLLPICNRNHTHDSDIENDFNNCIDIAKSIKNDKQKSNMTVFLKKTSIG